MQPKAKESTGPPPPLQGEPLHQQIARLNRELTKATEELQAFNREWAQKNIQAQSVRLPISTPELTFAANKRRELAAEIQRIQSELGIANRERRALNAQASQKAAGADQVAQVVVSARKKIAKRCPLKEHPQWAIYFHLAAQTELTTELYSQIERTAKSLLADALKMGVEEP